SSASCHTDQYYAHTLIFRLHDVFSQTSLLPNPLPLDSPYERISTEHPPITLDGGTIQDL
ncbi:MAG TPA: hypothetical protein VGE39_19420, partial [Prosthecobacter sp.]